MQRTQGADSPGLDFRGNDTALVGDHEIDPRVGLGALTYPEDRAMEWIGASGDYLLADNMLGQDSPIEAMQIGYREQLRLQARVIVGGAGVEKLQAG